MGKIDRFADFLDSDLRNAFEELKDPGIFLIPRQREMTVFKCENVDCWWAIRIYTIYSTVHWHDIASDYLVTMPVSHTPPENLEYIDISWQDFFENDEHWTMSKSELSRDQSVLLFGENEVREKSCFDNPDKHRTVDYWRSHYDF
jgi:hypothetical protein